MQEQILIAALVVLTAACAKDPSESAPKATVTEPAPKTPAAPAGEEKAAPATPEKPEKPTAADAPAAPVKGPKIAVEPKPITPGHVILGGRVGFVGSKVTGKHECLFREFKGTAIKGEKAGEWSLKVEIDVASVFCDPNERTEWSAKLDAHMINEDFFDAAKYPKATFESTEVRAEIEGENTHVVKGNLTIRDTTKEISFPAKVQLGDKRVSGKAEFTINRKDFGVVYPGKPDDLIRDGVVLKLQLSGSKG